MGCDVVDAQTTLHKGETEKKKKVESGLWNGHFSKWGFCAQTTIDFAPSWFSPLFWTSHVFAFSELTWNNFDKHINHHHQFSGRFFFPLCIFAQGVVSKGFLHYTEVPSLDGERRYRNTQFLVPVLPLPYWATSRSLSISLGTAASSAKEVDWSIWVIIFWLPAIPDEA